MLDTEAHLRERIADLEQLIRWLARTYGDNMPIWPPEDRFGNRLDAGQRLRVTYLSVMGPISRSVDM